MKTNKQEREYHKIKKANRQMHYDNVSEEEAIKNNGNLCIKFYKEKEHRNKVMENKLPGGSVDL